MLADTLVVIRAVMLVVSQADMPVDMLAVTQADMLVVMLVDTTQVLQVVS
jgi:hypothetical protein